MKYQKGDCRAHGPLDSKPLTLHTLGKREGYPETKAGPNRHERRTSQHFRGIRMNSRGVPVGFNVQTWNSRCQDVAAMKREDDASKGVPYKTPGKQKRYARPQDFLKGKPTASILRGMVRRQGLKETILLMHGRKK